MHPRGRPLGDPVATGPEVIVCRGCCCGNPVKHPGTDHERQLCLLRSATEATPGASLRIVGCLGECSSSNVVVLHGQRDRGAVWVPQVLDQERTDAVARWIAAGGPGNAEAPAALAGTTFEHRTPRNTRPPVERSAPVFGARRSISATTGSLPAPNTPTGSWQQAGEQGARG